MKTRLSLVLLVGAGCLMSAPVSAQVIFTGSGTGEIPDGTGPGPTSWGEPLNVTFNVSGLSASIADISLTMSLRHTWGADLEVFLIPPEGSGASPFLIFSRVGQQMNSEPPSGGYEFVFSDGSVDYNPGTYTFRDSASGDLWAAAGFDTSTGTVGEVFNVEPGSYRTSVAGPWDLAGNPNGGNENAGQFTSFAVDSGFIGLSPEQAEGTWTLRFRDGALIDQGEVTAAQLSFALVPEPAEYAVLAGLGLAAFAGYRRFRQAPRQA